MTSFGFWAAGNVWNSTDGIKWDLVQSELPFHYTDLPMTIVFKRTECGYSVDHTFGPGASCHQCRVELR